MSPVFVRYFSKHKIHVQVYFNLFLFVCELVFECILRFYLCAFLFVDISVNVCKCISVRFCTRTWLYVYLWSLYICQFEWVYLHAYTFVFEWWRVWVNERKCEWQWMGKLKKNKRKKNSKTFSQYIININVVSLLAVIDSADQMNRLFPVCFIEMQMLSENIFS